MKFILEPAQELADGVWLAVAAPHQLARLGQPNSSRGPRSVVLATSSEFEGEKRQLLLNADSVAILNLGTTPSVLVIDTKIEADGFARQVAQAAGYGPGDSEFRSLVEL